MKSCILVAAVLAAACQAATVEEPKLVHTYELVRHGARAPNDGPAFPKTPPAQLGPQGMRARYLLGRYNYHKYKELLEGNAEDVEMVADDVWRTTMSGNSELLGMVHDANGDKCPFQLPERQKSVKLPQFNVRRAKQIEIELNLNASVTTMIQVPVYN